MRRLLLLALVLTGCATSQLKIDTTEAEAVLAIAAKRPNVTEADWQRLFSTRGFMRLKEREQSMKRPFDEALMRDFVTSTTFDPGLQRALETWHRVDLSRAASLALRYLPAGTKLRATIYPVIKPRDNSFVFDLGGDPAIFMFVREEPREKFENTIAHELHHIGFASACSSKSKVAWTSAFGEGVAMLAAAGGPDVHPHAVSSADDRARWDRDVAKVADNLRAVESFLLDVAHGRLDDEAAQKRAMEFFGVQGPWYTVGWVMATTIEKELGRKALVDAMCNGTLLATYNRAAANKPLPRWSDELLRALE